MTELIDTADIGQRIVEKRRPSWLFGFGTALVLLSLFLMVAGPWLAPYDPSRPTMEVSEPPPELASVPGLMWSALRGAPHPPIHWFGTDATGLDVFSRVIAAPRTDVAIAVGANLASLIIGSLLGLLAGFARSWIAVTVMRLSDLIQAFPVFITGMILVTLAGRSNSTIIVTLAFLYTPIYVRLTRAEVLAQRARGFVDASRALGKSELFIALRHVLPNALAPSLIQASVTIGFAILMTAGLSFVGAGVRPPSPEWGLMIAASANDLIQGEWWSSLFPGLAISLTVFGYAAFGNGLERIYAE
ncbi:ABC transporter permease [Bradyrhizobium sp. HKCCYLS3077]|uniref:ABC transporter permease n=1 Tax=Bradyrhizobium sp. HKCCYLS3077 TaxID=3420761 RepID=UPI003EBFF66A